MDYGESTGLWQRVDLFEQSLCLRVNRGCRYPAVRALFAVVSRLGDGVAWYMLMLLLISNGQDGAVAAAHMALTGIAGLAIYQPLKRRSSRRSSCRSCCW